jgi:hypothetical protein
MQPVHVAHFTLTIPEPFNFTLTVARPAGWHWSTPREIFESGTLWTAVRVRGVTVGLKMSARKNMVQVRAYTPFPLATDDTNDLKELILSAPGADEDLAGFLPVRTG